MRHKLYPRRLLPRRIGSFVGQPWTPRSHSSHPHSSRPRNHPPHSPLLHPNLPQTLPRNLRLHKHLLNGFIFSLRNIGT